MPRLRLLLSALRTNRLGVLFAVLIGLGVGFWQWGKPPKPRIVLENVGPRPKVYFAPDGRALATWSGEDYPHYSLTLWNGHTGEKKLDLYQGHWGSFCGLGFSADGKTVACRFHDKICVWNIEKGLTQATYDDKDGFDYPQIVFTPDGKLLVMHENSILWNVAENKLEKKLLLDGERVIGGRDNSLLVVGKGDTIKIWDLPNTILCKECRIPNHPWQAVSIAPDRSLLFSHKEGLIYNLNTGEPREIPRPELSGPPLAPNWKMVAVQDWFSAPQSESWWGLFTEWLGIQDQDKGPCVTLHTFPSGEQISVLKHCSSPVFSPDSRSLAVTGTDGISLQLWDLPIRKPIGKILAQAGLAALATLLALNGLSWLRRRRSKEHAQLIASGSAAQVPMPGTK
jgi:WD40 repeat protein